MHTATVLTLYGKNSNGNDAFIFGGEKSKILFSPFNQVWDDNVMRIFSSSLFLPCRMSATDDEN